LTLAAIALLGTNKGRHYLLSLLANNPLLFLISGPFEPEPNLGRRRIANPLPAGTEFQIPPKAFEGYHHTQLKRIPFFD
jgi:hypothetical protein